MRFVRYVGTGQCKDDEYQESIDNGRDIIVDWVSATANASVDFRLDGKPLYPDIRQPATDFLDLGILVYLADEMVTRAHTFDYWTRNIRCLVPVVDPDSWRRNEELLTSTLSILSGDSWEFKWIRLDGSPPVRLHRRGLPDDYNVVCLFSGGIDSLLGAVQILDKGLKVLLVGHQAEGQTASAQTALANMLKKLYSDQISLIQCRVSRSPRRYTQFRLAAKTEISHRPRSFLFLALGVAIATRCGIDDVFMPENGFMALNIPLQKSRTGALSTRTAHPSFMLRFIKLAKEAAGFAGFIRNPFLTQSKTDMLRGLPAFLRPLIQRSISCARPSRFNDRNVRHCGYCVPCIHRRIALMEADMDSAGQYAFDVFNNFPSLDRDKQQDFRAVVRFAVRVSGASTAQLQTLVLSHGHFPSDVGGTIGTADTENYDPWVEMLRRWAIDFISKVQNKASAQTRAALGFSTGRRRD